MSRTFTTKDEIEALDPCCGARAKRRQMRLTMVWLRPLVGIRASAPVGGIWPGCARPGSFALPARSVESLTCAAHRAGGCRQTVNPAAPQSAGAICPTGLVRIPSLPATTTLGWPAAHPRTMRERRASRLRGLGPRCASCRPPFLQRSRSSAVTPKCYRSPPSSPRPSSYRKDPQDHNLFN